MRSRLPGWRMENCPVNPRSGGIVWGPVAAQEQSRNLSAGSSESQWFSTQESMPGLASLLTRGRAWWDWEGHREVGQGRGPARHPTTTLLCFHRRFPPPNAVGPTA